MARKMATTATTPAGVPPPKSGGAHPKALIQKYGYKVVGFLVAIVFLFAIGCEYHSSPTESAQTASANASASSCLPFSTAETHSCSFGVEWTGWIDAGVKSEGMLNCIVPGINPALYRIQYKDMDGNSRDWSPGVVAAAYRFRATDGAMSIRYENRVGTCPISL